MKSLKGILFMIIIILAAGSQLIYVFTVHQSYKQKIADNENQITATQRELKVLEQKLELLPQTKEELKKMNKEKTAVLNAIPTTASAAKEFVQIVNIAELNNFFKFSLKHTEDIDYNDDIGNVKEKKYTLSFVSTFGESQKFIENLNSSYEMINIHHYSADNSVQVSEEKDMKLIRLWYGDKAKELVMTKVDFSMFARPDVKIDEIYEPEFNLNYNRESTFFNRDKVKMDVQTTASDSNEILPASVPAESEATESAGSVNGEFRLDILDPLTSGDTYKFLGPGNDEKSYTGLLSVTDTYITVTIKKDGYDVVMEDENGNVKQNSVLMPLEDLNFTILSQMRQLEAKMPQVHIYIRSYSDAPIPVTLKGTLLENIHIYNEFDEEVLKGQTKGKVKLT